MRVAIISGAEYSLGWGRSQNLAREFALAGDEVFYLNAITPLISKETLSNREMPLVSAEGVHLYYMKGLPVIKVPLLASPNHHLLKMQLDSILTAIEHVDLILFYGVPEPWMVSYIKKNLAYNTSAYDCAGDKATMFHDLKGSASGRVVANWERYLLKQVDFAVGMSEAVCTILEEKSDLPVYRIENGVDLNLFQRREEEQLHGGPRRMVYTGAINDRLDIEKLKECALQNSVDIDLYGNENPVLELIKDVPNIHYRGYVSYFTLPTILQNYDYGILPNRDIASIRNSSPLKVLQYLAVGLPVVSFPFPVWPELTDYVQLTEGDLHTIDEYATLPTKESMEHYSWHERILEYKELLYTRGVA